MMEVIKLLINIDYKSIIDNVMDEYLCFKRVQILREKREFQ